MTTAMHTAQLDLLGPRPLPQPDGWTFRAQFDAARLSSSRQKVFYELLDGNWHPLSELRKIAGSAADSRLRDLRKQKFGGFTINARRDPCNPTSGCWQYRLATGLLKQAQLDLVKRQHANG